MADDTIIRVDGDIELEVSRDNLNIDLGTNTTRFAFIGDGSESATFDAGNNKIGFEGEMTEIVYKKIWF